MDWHPSFGNLFQDEISAHCEDLILLPSVLNWFSVAVIGLPSLPLIEAERLPLPPVRCHELFCFFPPTEVGL